MRWWPCKQGCFPGSCKPAVLCSQGNNIVYMQANLLPVSIYIYLYPIISKTSASENKWWTHQMTEWHEGWRWSSERINRACRRCNENLLHLAVARSKGLPSVPYWNRSQQFAGGRMKRETQEWTNRSDILRRWLITQARVRMHVWYRLFILKRICSLIIHLMLEKHGNSWMGILFLCCVTFWGPFKGIGSG